jgi:3-phenylpropionate/cinnamic acid dioxygenase small subunit
MADRQAIEDLFARYAWGMDARKFEYTKGTFGADSRFTLEIAGEQAIEPLEGAAIGDFIEATVSQQTDVRRHLLTNVRLEDEREDSATAYAYLSLLVTENGELSARATGIYRTEVVREDGRWRFRGMHLALDRAY